MMNFINKNLNLFYSMNDNWEENYNDYEKADTCQMDVYFVWENY